MKTIPTILLCLFLSACTTGQTVNVETFEKGLQNTEVQLLDVRTDEEYAEAHLPDALQADVNDGKAFAKKIAGLDKNKPVYVYCRSGRRSQKAANQLKAQGFKEVVNLDGGIEAWKEEGKPVETNNQ